MVNSLPRWDMSSIYPSVDSKEFSQDLDRIYALSDELEKMVQAKRSILDILKLDDEVSAIALTVSAYSEVLLTTDTTNPAYIKAVGKTDDACTRLSSAESLMVSSLAERLDEFNSSELSEYSQKLNEIKIKAEHQMPIDQERLAGEFLSVSSSAWERLQSSVTSSISSGDKTLIELRGLATNPDREIRKDAFEREVGILKEHEIALTAALNGVKGTVLLLEKKRGWSDPIDRSIFKSRINHKILDALIGALEDSRPMFQDYLKTKAKLLGIEKMDFYDLFAPVGKSEKSYSFDEARRLVFESYNAFSPDAGRFISSAFDRNWIDAEPRKGKVGGAYEEAFPLRRECRILCNFDGSYDSVSTLAHELGHAYHSMVISDLPVSQNKYPMTLAETASIFGETLLFDHVLSTTKHDEQLPIIESYVQSACQVCIDILSRYYFEKEAFARRRDGELTPNDFCSIMLDAEERAYGDGIGRKHPYMWAVKSHYYSEGFSFYNYPYAFGQLFALGLFSLKDSVDDFPMLYNKLLRLTGKMPAKDVASSVGIDIESRDFWDKGIKVISGYAEKLKEWT